MSAPAPARKRGPGQSEFSRLAAEMESPKGLDPIPPDQYLYFLGKKEPPLQRLLALVRASTIQRGRRSAHCVDEHGKELRLADLRRALEMDWGNFRRTVDEAKTRGLIRVGSRSSPTNTGGDRSHRPNGGASSHPQRVFLCGNVAESVGYKEPAEDTTSLYRLVLLTSEQRKIYDGWPAEKQVRFYAEFEHAVKYKEQVEKEAIILAREITDRALADVFAAHELPKKQLPKRRADPTRIQLRLIESVQTESVPTGAEGSVPTENRESVPSGASLLPSEKIETRAASVGRSLSETPDGPTDRHADPEDYGAKIAALKTLLIEEYGRRFPDTPRPRLCGDVLSALEGAPLDRLRAHIRQRMQSATGMGFALSLANDVGRRWTEEAPARAKAEAARDRHAQANREQTAILCQETIEDPQASAEEKQIAREYLKAAAAGGAS